MKREIKFRAWDNGKMWYPETKTVDNNDTFFAFFNYAELTIGWGLYDRKLESRIVSGEYDAVLMQFTGLKDKNEKEIYEGDIIQNEFGKKTVKWEDAGFFCAEEKTIMKIYFWLLDLSKIEVIGNIYENPELL